MLIATDPLSFSSKTNLLSWLSFSYSLGSTRVSLVKEIHKNEYSKIKMLKMGLILAQI